MTKQVIIVHNDTRKPGKEISSITGNNSYGDTIFKRISLRERTKRLYENIPQVMSFCDVRDASQKSFDNKTPVIEIYSDHVVKDIEQVQTLVNKALYAHENYKIVQNNKVAAVIYASMDNFRDSKKEDVARYETITVDCFADISEVTCFRQFITSGFEARFFNSLSGDEYTVVKSSKNKEKLKAEYTYYGLLPENMKQWFARPFNYTEGDDIASYSMQRYHMTDLAIRYIHGAIALQEFEDILRQLFHFIKIRQTKSITADEYEQNAKRLYVDKVADRIEALKKAEGYDKIANLIATQTCYKSIDEVFEKYKRLFDIIRKDKKFLPIAVVGHGDLCFSNILYNHDAELLVLIDPRGAMSEDELYMDPYYDLAKLSHSICGHYDFFNSDLYEIVADDELNAHINVDANNLKYVESFKAKLEENSIDFKLIRMYEASLFLSMLPLHMDRPKKVFAFVLNAIAIMKSLEDNI